MSRFRIACLALLIFGMVLSLDSKSAAQKKAPPTGNTKAPRLAPPGPLGVQRGTALDLTLTGSNLAQATGLWISIPGAKISIPTDADNGKENNKLRVRLEVPKDAPLGFYGLRLANPYGISNLRLFCVDDLPQVLSNEKNHAPAIAQSVPVPCVVAGRIATESADYYKFSVQAGQRLSFDCLGHRLGSQIDPQITLFDVRRQRELPGGHNNDAPGLQNDARLTYHFADSGEYIVEIRDVIYRGGDEYGYRLRIGDFPCATSPLPMAVKRGAQATVAFAGPYVDGVWPSVVETPSDPTAAVVWVAPRGPSGLHGWPVALALSDHDELLEQEPNDTLGQANRLPVPGGITAGFQSKGDVDHFVFAARKGQRLVIETHAQELYSPCEVYMTIKDAKGAEMAKTNPTTPPRLNFTAAADGDYTVTVEHLFNWNGATENYRLTVRPQDADFDLTLSADRLDISQGGSAVVTVTAVRRDLKGAIELSVSGPSGVSGQATLGTGQTTVPLFVHAAADAALQPGVIMVQGQAHVNGKTIVRSANVRTVLGPDLAGLMHPPLDLEDKVGIAVTEKAPFTLTAHAKQSECLVGGSLPVLVMAARMPGFTEDIALEAVGLPATFTPALKSIPKGKNEIEVQLTATPKAGLGSYAVALVGKTKFQNGEFAVPVPVSFTLINMPFDLRVEPASLKLKPGEKAKLKVRALRRAGYQGAIAVEIKNLPAQVTAGKVTLKEGQTEGEIELSADAAAPAGEKKDVSASGSGGGKQASSGAITVSVGKK